MSKLATLRRLRRIRNRLRSGDVLDWLQGLVKIVRAVASRRS